jgi:hypothetical protein
MTWNNIAGAASVMALFVPVLLICLLRLYRNGSLLLLSVYYLLQGIYNLMSMGWMPGSPDFVQLFGIAYNYIDIPLMLLVLLFFCNEKWKRQVIYATLFLYLFFELYVAFLYGLQPQSSLYILGPGTFIILLYSLYFFIHFGKLSIAKGKSMGKTLMVAAILFSYSLFALIYYFHYIEKTPAVADVFLLYYIVTFISCSVMCLGLVWVSKRMCQLQELQQMRRELALFFDYQKA